jgi:hypothetical protein
MQKPRLQHEKTTKTNDDTPSKPPVNHTRSTARAEPKAIDFSRNEYSAERDTQNCFWKVMRQYSEKWMIEMGLQSSPHFFTPS